MKKFFLKFVPKALCVKVMILGILVSPVRASELFNNLLEEQFGVTKDQAAYMSKKGSTVPNITPEEIQKLKRQSQIECPVTEQQRREEEEQARQQRLAAEQQRREADQKAREEAERKRQQDEQQAREDEARRERDAEVERKRQQDAAAEQQRREEAERKRQEEQQRREAEQKAREEEAERKRQQDEQQAREDEARREREEEQRRIAAEQQAREEEQQRLAAGRLEQQRREDAARQEQQARDAEAERKRQEDAAAEQLRREDAARLAAERLVQENQDRLAEQARIANQQNASAEEVARHAQQRIRATQARRAFFQANITDPSTEEMELWMNAQTNKQRKKVITHVKKDREGRLANEGATRTDTQRTEEQEREEQQRATFARITEADNLVVEGEGDESEEKKDTTPFSSAQLDTLTQIVEASLPDDTEMRQQEVVQALAHAKIEDPSLSLLNAVKAFIEKQVFKPTADDIQSWIDAPTLQKKNLIVAKATLRGN